MALDKIKFNIKQLITNKGVIKYVKNTSWLLVEKILRMSISLFVSIWVIRYLGPEQFGLLSYSQSFVALFAVFATLGLDSIVIRELVRDESKRDVLLGTAFVLKLIGATLVFSIISIAIFYTNNSFITKLMITIIASASIFQSFNVIDFYFQSKVLSKYVVYVNLIVQVFSSAIKLFLIFFNASLIYFAIVIVLDYVLFALGYIVIYSKEKLSVKNWSFSFDVTKIFFVDALPLIIAGVANSIYMKIDQVMIKEMKGSADVGYYASAVKLSEAWFIIGVIISNSFFPALVNAKRVSNILFLNRLSKLFRILNSISFFIAFFVYLYSDAIITILYGNKFQQAIPVLEIHIFSSIFVFLGVSSGRWLIIEGKTMLNFYRNAIGVVVNIGLNFLLIPKYGIVGAAIGSLVAYIIAFYIFDLFNKDTRQIFYLKTKSFFLIHN